MELLLVLHHQGLLVGHLLLVHGYLWLLLLHVHGLHLLLVHVQLTVHHIGILFVFFFSSLLVRPLRQLFEIGLWLLLIGSFSRHLLLLTKHHQLLLLSEQRQELILVQLVQELFAQDGHVYKTTVVDLVLKHLLLQEHLLLEGHLILVRSNLEVWLVASLGL